MKAAKVITLDASRLEQGGALAQSFAIPHIDATAHALDKARHIENFIRLQTDLSLTEPQFVFLLTRDGLSLAQLSPTDCLSIRADFHGGTVRYRRQKGGGKNQMIAKAVGLSTGQTSTILDATAGLGGDAFVLASLGCDVTLIERVPEVRTLLADALAQGRIWGEANDSELVSILKRMSLIEADAVPYLHSLDAETAPDVIYLDPMFPPRSKTAQVKKEMRVFHQLVGTDPDAADLLPAALACARKRVVVKRPRIASALASEKPSFALEGKSNRFDVYVCA